MTSPAVVGIEGLSRERLLDAYRSMRKIRGFEDRVYREFQVGTILGSCHLYAGQEAIAVGVCTALRPDDYIAGTHRGHGHAIAKGCDLRGMFAELFGRATGLCHGRGGSMHIADVSKGMLGANGIVGASAPIATGAAFTSKVLGTGQVAVAFVGDGGANQGMFLESLNLSSVWRVPVVFVVEDNMYAGSISATYHLCDVDVAKRAEGFCMPGVTVDGFDFFAVYSRAREAVERARGGGGPTLLECKASRFYGHFVGDPQLYRTKEEVPDLRANKDPLMLFSRRVVGEGVIRQEELDEIDASVARQIDEAVELALEDPFPDPSTLLDGVYVSY
jgi:pyruvate dehydrogenase E1 component alpha subunit